MIRVENISKTFHDGTLKEFCALKEVSFTVGQGEVFVLSGVSGSGKSTLLSLMAALYKPTCGEIFIDGVSIAKLPENFASRFRRENIGIIFQNFGLIPTLSVFENVLLPALPDKKDVSKKACELLEKFNMLDKKDILSKELSGGEQQRVSIVRSLINSPKVILADEPTANLDKTLSIKFLDMVELIVKEGCIVVIATHDELLLKWEKVTSMYELEKLER